MNRPGISKKRLFRHRLFTLGLCLIFFAQLVSGATQLSLTSDEPTHFIHGYTALRSGDTWALLQHRHPPLMNAWVAWPLLLQPERPVPQSAANWGGDFVLYVRELWPQFGPIERVAFVSRYPNMLLGLLLIALVFRWTRERFGKTGGWLAIVAMAFDPTMIAHAQLNTTDISMTLFTFACLFMVARLKQGVNRWKLVSIGLLLGATMAAKGSGIMVLPVVYGLIGWQIVAYTWRNYGKWNRSSIWHAARQIVQTAFLVTLPCFILLWASYRFRLEPVPGTKLQLPLVSHARMIWMILTASSRTAFLLGEVRQGGWWGYFPLAFIVKTPIPLILALGAALFSQVFARRSFAQDRSKRRRPCLSAALWLFPLLYIIIAIRSGMNIGYRHLLPVFPFAYVTIGRLGPRLSPSASLESDLTSQATPRVRLRTTLKHVVLFGLSLWLILGTLNVYPFAIAYFNELAGGPEKGHRYLVDSNHDWGQSFKALQSYMNEEDIPWVWLSYYTWIDPAAYGVRYRPLPPAPGIDPTFPRRFNPTPGIYAISTTPLQGVMIAESDLYDWFRHREPISRPGYGLFVYDVQPPQAPPQWLAQCTTPALPLTPAAITDGFGRDNDLRQILFDCTQSWIYPGDGKTPGCYALHQDVIPDIQPYLAELTLSYEQRQPAQLPAFALYESSDGGYAPPTKPDMPVQMGALTFLGHAIVRTDEVSHLEIATWWRVNEIPDRPLSLMLHLVGPGDTSVGDGLGIPREVWQVGDVIVQRHKLHLPENAPAGTYQTMTGVYWLDTLERWTVMSGPQAGADTISLTSITLD